jgi:hypothetical protein
MFHASIARSTGRAIAVALTIACAGVSAASAAQANLGSYVGTIELESAQPTLTYKARVKAAMPVSERKASAINAEFAAGEAPNATVAISRWDTFSREKSADSGGQFNTVSCSLAAPVEIPMSATGVLEVDLAKKRHAFSLILVSLRDIALNCTHSRSGPFKKKTGIALAMGTGVPGQHFENPLPFADPTQLSGSYRLDPAKAGVKEYAPIDQTWQLKLAQ